MMSESEWVTCDHCDGTGRVLDYDAIDIQLGQNDWTPTTHKNCPSCEGHGQVRVNKEQTGLDTPHI